MEQTYQPGGSCLHDRLKIKLLKFLDKEAICSDAVKFLFSTNTKRHIVIPLKLFFAFVPPCLKSGPLPQLLQRVGLEQCPDLVVRLYELIRKASTCCFISIDIITTSLVTAQAGGGVRKTNK